ncbi:unnamed protein product [Prorocentrum cordatum]|uniref:PH domain-containing protein n=1 Tax=Prorocentrum cordatum TaxID=2364126 RepID=A0ABN9TVI9_9DINO|nr:unnamed protein product [Polarella glacialis]
MTAVPSLDVWSVGMTICELVTLDVTLKPTYTSFLQNGRSHRHAGFLFMDWLSGIRNAPLPKSMKEFDQDCLDLLTSWLLVPDCTKRKTLAQCLVSPFIMAAGSACTAGSPVSSPLSSASVVSAPSPSGGQDTTFTGGDAAAIVARSERIALDVPSRAQRKEVRDHTALYKGILWKLNRGGDPAKSEHWLKRDMWLTSSGSLCYHSLKEDKRLILIDGDQLASGELALFSGGAIQPAIEIKVSADTDDREHQATILGCESHQDYAAWTRALESARLLAMQTFHLGPSLAVQLKAFRLAVKNRRLKVSEGARDECTPVFKSKLWKLKADTDRGRGENWFEREMWISQNGSLVYFSVKEERELIYYTPSDLASASFVELGDGGSCKRWGFHVALPAKDGVEFTPSEFAAESRELRAQWIEQLRGL